MRADEVPSPKSQRRDIGPPQLLDDAVDAKNTSSGACPAVGSAWALAVTVHLRLHRSVMSTEVEVSAVKAQADTARESAWGVAVRDLVLVADLAAAGRGSSSAEHPSPAEPSPSNFSMPKALWPPTPTRLPSAASLSAEFADRRST